MPDTENFFDVVPPASVDTSEAERHLEAGRPVFYVDPELGDDIIKEMPDGTRFRVRLGEQMEPEIIEEVPCRAYGL